MYIQFEHEETSLQLPNLIHNVYFILKCLFVRYKRSMTLIFQSFYEYHYILNLNKQIKLLISNKTPKENT